MSVSESFPATLLVPGWSDSGDALAAARAFLLDRGWPATHVACMNFRDRYGSNIEHAAEIALAVEGLRRISRAGSVAIVAHSMGGLATRYYLAREGAGAPVRRVVFAGTPHRGTWAAWLAWGRGGAEMRPGSGFLRGLERTRLPGHVSAVCVRTPLETHVLPFSSAALPGTPCHVVRAPLHPRMLRHPPTLSLICDLLLDREERRALSA